jgi:hypothetical protein
MHYLSRLGWIGAGYKDLFPLSVVDWSVALWDGLYGVIDEVFQGRALHDVTI